MDVTQWGAMASIGYARVSTREEGRLLDQQKHALKAAGCERTFEDRISGAHADRPGLKTCLDDLRQDDVLVVLDLDRLGCRTGDLVRLVNKLGGRGIGFRVLNTAFDTTTPAGRSFLQIQAAFAEMERNLTRQRVSEGIAAARVHGRKGGRPRVMTPERLRHAQRLMADQTRSIAAICRELGSMPTTTLSHYLHAGGLLTAPGRKLLEADVTAGAVVPSAPLQEPTPSKVQRLHAVA